MEDVSRENLQVNTINFVEPQIKLRIRGHTPIATGRKGYAADFRTIRNASTFELTSEKSHIKHPKPMLDVRRSEAIGKGNARQQKQLTRAVLKSEEMIKEEIIQDVRTDGFLGFLSYLAVFIRRQQFRRNRRIANIIQVAGDFAGE